jgi:hypothetical protein
VSFEGLELHNELSKGAELTPKIAKEGDEQWVNDASSRLNP